MANESSINKEKSRSSESGEKVSYKMEKDKEIRQAEGKEAVRSAVDLDETTEVMGDVSEKGSEAKDVKGDGVSAGAKTYDPAQIRSNLLKNIPTEVEMKKNIEKEIKKEIRYLHKKAVKLMAVPSSMSYFEMANLMKKIRELKGLLLKLVKASLDTVKTLWLRFVHGVM